MSLLVQNRKDFLSVPSKNRLLELFTVQSMLKIAIILGKNGFFMYFFVKTGLHLLHLIPNFLLLIIENNCSKLNKMTLLILILFSQCIVNLFLQVVAYQVMGCFSIAEWKFFSYI